MWGNSARKGTGLSNLAVRILTAAVAVPVLLYLLLLAPQWGFVALLALAGAIAGAELFAMTMPQQRLQQVWGVAAVLVVFAAVNQHRDPEWFVAVMMVVVLGGMLAALLRPEPMQQAAARMGWLIAGPVYLGVLLGAQSLLFLRHQGGLWVVLAATFSWFGDTGAYFAGRAFGKRKLYPSVSPGKTVAGAFGGLAGSVLGAVLAHLWYLPSLPLREGVALALVAGLMGQLGDLCESLIKRSAGAKDSGRIVPGHGGLLDRIDSLLFAAVPTWAYAEWLYS